MTHERTRRPGLTPAERSLRARIGAYAMHARNDPRETTRAARAAFAQRFVDEVDPLCCLPEPERFRRAEAARKAYFSRIAYLAARSRNRRKRPGDPPRLDKANRPL